MNIEIPFPDLRTDDDASPDGEPDAASLAGDTAHQCTSQAVAAMRKAGQDGTNNDNAAAHALAVKAHSAAVVAMKDAGRDDEAAMHQALATEHDHQKCRALLKAKD